MGSLCTNGRSSDENSVTVSSFTTPCSVLKMLTALAVGVVGFCALPLHFASRWKSMSTPDGSFGCSEPLSRSISMSELPLSLGHGGSLRLASRDAFLLVNDGPADQAGQKVQLLVTYILSPADGIFYALDDSRKDVIRDSLTTLQQMPKDLLTKAPPAGAVFAVYLDNVWHRAICNMPAAGSDTAALYLLDMGETLAYSDHLPKAKLPSDLCQLPAYAIKCQVSHTAAALPLSLYYSVSCSVVAVENDTLIVEHAEPSREEYAISRDTFTVEELQEMDEMPLSTSNPMKAVLGYVPKDDDRLCKHYDPETKRCFKGSNCRLRHAPKDPDGWTLDKDTVTVSVPARMEVPQTNTYIQLLPTCVVDVDQFYAHIIGNERNDKDYEQLMAEMNDPETIANFKPFKLMPSLGELVIAKYDGIWYRATVCDVFDDMVNVFYFDYGNTATVGSSEVRRWEDRFKYLPYQAACCRIANIQRIKPCHLEAIDQLYKSILDKPMKALVM
uniref:C3H1-type domain-containing protein n=1 Tax=Anopheles melas TaxID=34690 RepID=A0A182TEL8_9DIPT